VPLLLLQAQVVDRAAQMLADAFERRHERVRSTGFGRRESSTLCFGERKRQLLQRFVVQVTGQAPAFGVAHLAEALVRSRTLDRAREDVGDRLQEADVELREAPPSRGQRPEGLIRVGIITLSALTTPWLRTIALALKRWSAATSSEITGLRWRSV